MRKVVLGILFLLILAIGFYIGMNGFTGQTIKEYEYSYTKAICNDKNQCIDIFVKCRNGEVESLTPMSDLKDFGEDWEKAGNLTSEKLCE